MGIIKNFFKKIKCKCQNEECISNYYGDCILFYAFGNRSVWKCKDCGNIFFKPHLDKNCKIINYIF